MRLSAKSRPLLACLAGQSLLHFLFLSFLSMGRKPSSAKVVVIFLCSRLARQRKT